MTTQATTAAAALHYLALGWSIIPVQPGQKAGTPFSWAAYQKRRPTQEEVEAWWSQKDWNIALICGQVSGVFALDLDVHGGQDGVAAVKRLHAWQPDNSTPTARTGGGGIHCFFKCPPGLQVRSRNFGEGIETKGEGGCITLPPSLHPSGKRYEWLTPPYDIPPPEPPAWLMELLQTQPAKDKQDWAQGYADGVDKGQRNDTAVRLCGHFVSRGYAPIDIEILLEQWNRKNRPPLERAELRKVLEAICKVDAQNHPNRTMEELLGRCTDAGNAELFAELYKEVVRYDHRRGRWLVWGRHCWREDIDGRIMRMAKEVARRRYREASAIEDQLIRKGITKWAIQSEAKTRLEAMLTLATAERPIADDGERWDTEPMLFAANNCIVNLKTAEPLAGIPEHGITLCTRVDYDIDAEPAPRWLAFLNQIFGGDQELIDFVWKATGYSLTGDISEQCLFILHGKGANGKSTFLQVLRHVIGEYAADTPFASFELENRSSIPNDLAALVGKRFITASETIVGRRMNEARMKALTGGDAITARFLHHEFFTFEPRGKIWLAVNHRPRVADLSEAFWRRVHLVPFEKQFMGAECKKDMFQELLQEAQAILTWAIFGCLKWQSEGLCPPEAVRSATADYKSESDPLAEFISERCALGAECSVQASELYRTYRTWAEGRGMKGHDLLSMQMFGRLMAERFHKRLGGQRKKVIVYDGIESLPVES